MPNKIEKNLSLNDIIILKKFAYYEFLAHTLAYQNLVDIGNTTELSILNYNEKQEFATVTRVPINNSSIVAYILSIESKDPNLPNKVQVIWRGTHDIGSAIADLDPISPGYQEYFKNRNSILSSVNKAIKDLTAKNGKPTLLGSYGHSLGGSLAQLFAVDAMDAITQNHLKNLQYTNEISKSDEKILSDLKYFSKKLPKASRDAFINVKHINIGTFNSAGISTETADRANILDQFLHNQIFLPENKQPKVSYFAGLNHGDGVQQTGAATILANSDRSHVYLLKTNINNDYYNKILSKSFHLGFFLILAAKNVILSTNLFTNLIFSKMLYSTTKKTLGTINSHTAKIFQEKTVNQREKQYYLQKDVVDGMELFKNNNLKDKTRIKNSLNKKSKLLQHPMIKFMQGKIYSITNTLYKKVRNT